MAIRKTLTVIVAAMLVSSDARKRVVFTIHGQTIRGGRGDELLSSPQRSPTICWAPVYACPFPQDRVLVYDKESTDKFTHSWGHFKC